MKQVSAAAIYARISSDQHGDGLGVQRQIEDCRVLARERAWAVAGEYVDNDISAYSGKHRPAYERMLRDIADGRIDAVLVYHLDRLTRRPIELEYFIEVCSAARVDVTAVTGDVGLGNDNGLMVARITSAMAAAESGRKSARIRRKILQNVQMGKPNGGGQRPYGFEWDGVAVRESEARIIRDLAERYIGGESLNSLTRWMNDQRIPTAGKAALWHVQTVRGILCSGRIAGLRDHHGKPAAPASWPAIITIEQHEQVLAVFASKQSPQPARRRYLLSGLVRCGTCGGTLLSQNSRGIRRYACSRAPGATGCGRLSVNAVKLEEAVVAAILVRLDAPEFADLLIARAGSDDGNLVKVTELMHAQRALTDLAEMFGAGEISRAEFAAARKAAQQRQAAALRALDSITGSGMLKDLSDEARDRASSWKQLPLERQRAIAQTVLTTVTISASSKPSRVVDPARVLVAWTA